MNRRLIVFALILLIGFQGAFAQTPEAEIPHTIRNNRYFQESLRFMNLARLAYAEGDYLASMEFSEEAMRFAYLSDEFVRLQLKIRETDNAIAAARIRLDFAVYVNAHERYPEEYAKAQEAFAEARAYRAAEEWDPAIEAANRVLAFLAHIEPMPGLLPAQYTVRLWTRYRDSLWDIAGRPWVFNDPWQWRRLYEANRDRMPEPGNPDLIHPGMVLDIPSIRGEIRQGMWNPTATYPPLP